MLTLRQQKIQLVYKIVMEENLSILEIVSIKESVMQEKYAALNTLNTSLAFSASALFSETKERENMKKPTAQAIVDSEVFKGTPFEKEMIRILNN